MQNGLPGGLAIALERGDWLGPRGLMPWRIPARLLRCVRGRRRGAHRRSGVCNNRPTAPTPVVQAVTPLE